MSEVIKKLSSEELSNYAGIKKVVKTGLKSFIEVGNALMQLRKDKLYREEYGTFEECCEAEFGITRQRAYQFIDASEMAGNLSTRVDKDSLSEKHLRPLKAILPEKRDEVFSKAVDAAESNGRTVTGNDVKKAVKESIEDMPFDPNYDPIEAVKPKTEKLFDDDGNRIPIALKANWEYRLKLKELMLGLRRIRNELEREWNAKQPMLTGKRGFRPYSFQKVDADLKMAEVSIKVAIPRHVCPVCHGDDNCCDYCAGLGMISDFYYRNIPQALRAKNAKEDGAE